MEVNVLLFDDFETMDAFGPADILSCEKEGLHVNYLSLAGNMVNSMQGVKVWTEPLNPEQLKGILIVPGGRGASSFPGKRWIWRELFWPAESIAI